MNNGINHWYSVWFRQVFRQLIHVKKNWYKGIKNCLVVIFFSIYIRFAWDWFHNSFFIILRIEVFILILVDTKQDPPIVFISYQWDIQDEVNSLRDKLEKSGFSCWMDVGQMGGGDQLGARIDSGVRNCKV